MKAAPVLLFFVALAIVLLAWPSTPSEAASVAVRVDGPDGVWFMGNLTAPDAYEAMHSIATAQDWVLEVDGRPGQCTAYVKTIRGVGESGAGGWVFEIKRGGNWTGPLYTSADCTPLQDGDLLWWHWSADGQYEADKPWDAAG
ncbi:MAG: hypothetical protein ACPHK8_04595 [Thermoplasmatota archaeon]